MNKDIDSKGKRCIVKLHTEDSEIYMDEHSANINDSDTNIWKCDKLMKAVV